MTGKKVFRDYTENGVKDGAKLDEQDVEFPDLTTLLSAITTHSRKDLPIWLDEHANVFDATTVIVDADDAASLKELAVSKPNVIYNKKGLSYVRHLDTLLNASNDTLADGGYLWCHSRTSMLKHKIILSTMPGFRGKVFFAMHYFWHRVCAKLPFTRWFYMLVTKGKNRSLSRVEILGRFCRAGFDIVDERFCNGELYVLGRKTAEPRRHKARTYGLVIKLNRVGYKGKTIGVYKFRTMYPYAEYLQPYMMEHEGLARGGKYKNDYRINFWGRMFRKCHIDELPMLLNLLKGQVKLVGVRPLSRAYYSMYSPEMQKMHISVKPGLLPPFFYEEQTPQTIEDVQESERKYIEAWRKRPLATDWRYFWVIIGKRFFKRKK